MTRTYLSVYIIRAVIEEIAEKGVSWIIAPLLYMFLGVITSAFVRPINPTVLSYFYYLSFELAQTDRIEDTTAGFDYFLLEILTILEKIPSVLGSYIYVYAGAFAGYDYRRALTILKRNIQRRYSESYGLPVAAIAGLLGVQLSLTKIRPEGSILQRVVGDPIYQLKKEDIKDTLEMVLFSELYLLTIGALLTGAMYLVTTLLEIFFR